MAILYSGITLLSWKKLIKTMDYRIIKYIRLCPEFS